MTDDSPPHPPEPPSGIDTTVPHSARIWNYWLGGKDNYAVDREAGDQYREVFPYVIDVARQDRAFLGRAVRYLAGEAGIRQFLDIGTGLPTADNTHEVAQRMAPDSRIVYVDNDPLVLAHARALLTSTPEGKPTTSIPTCTTPTQLCGPQRGRWTSANPSRLRWWAFSVTPPTTTRRGRS